MKKFFRASILCVFIAAVFLSALPLRSEKAVIPGDVNRVCFYTDFFYNYPSEDFFYYLNDRLLFMEMPDGNITPKGLRSKLLKIVNWHKVIKRSLKRFKQNASNTTAFNLLEPRGRKKASVVLKLLGLELKTTETGKLKVIRNHSVGSSDYFNFSLIRTSALTAQINRTNYFHFSLKESKVETPWDFDFLSTVTGLDINAGNFFETMLRNEQFSLLLGTLYRLSGREIGAISRMMETMPGEAWKQIYSDRELLMGMFVLSHAIRVDQKGQLILPGGPEAASFWNGLAGKSSSKEPLEFLKTLATKDNGKLNYFYLFAKFLPRETQKGLFTGPAVQRMQEIYGALNLTDKEKLKGTDFPAFRNPNFFTVLYSLRMKGNQFHFSPNLASWLKVVRNGGAEDKNGKNGQINAASVNVFDLLAEIVEQGKKEQDMNSYKVFTSLYTKFHHKPHLMTEEILGLLYRNYPEYNVLVDYIERLPLQKTQTVVKLFEWVKKFDKLDESEKELFNALFQSTLELFAQASRYAPQRYNADILVEKLIAIPFDRLTFYDRMFEFFETQLNLDGNKRDLISFVLKGIDNQVLNIGNIDYRFMIKDICRKKVTDIMETQQVCSLGTLFQINRILDELNSKGSAVNPQFGDNLVELFQQMPYSEISSDAPRAVKARVMPYSRDKMLKDVGKLAKRIQKKAPKDDIRALTYKIKKDYLIHFLREHMLTLVYSINAKSPKLKVFLNPNVVRLHDFSSRQGRTAWNFCGTPKVADLFSEYHFCGGLSRLNIVFASKWHDHLFKRTLIYDPTHTQSVIVNLLDLYPDPQVNQIVTYNAMLVEFGIDLLQDAREDKKLREDVITVASDVTTGYHYRQAVRYVTGKAKNRHLFFSEIKRLGEAFFRGGIHLDHSAQRNGLEKFNRSPLAGMIGRQDIKFGGIYYHTYGNLEPQRLNLFPQALTVLFDSGYLSGEMIDEFKVKMSWHLYKKKVPSYLLGQVLYTYLNKTAPRFLSQNHDRDYASTYFVFDIFNNSHLAKIIKNMQKEGHLKLK